MNHESIDSSISISIRPVCEATLSFGMKLKCSQFVDGFKYTIEQFAKYSPDENTRKLFDNADEIKIDDALIEQSAELSKYIFAILNDEMSEDGQVMDEKVSFDEFHAVMRKACSSDWLFQTDEYDSRILFFIAYLMYACRWATPDECEKLVSCIDWEEAIDSPEEDDMHHARVWYVHVPKGFRLVEHLVYNYEMSYKFKNETSGNGNESRSTSNEDS